MTKHSLHDLDLPLQRSEQHLHALRKVTTARQLVVDLCTMWCAAFELYRAARDHRRPTAAFEAQLESLEGASRTAETLLALAEQQYQRLLTGLSLLLVIVCTSLTGCTNTELPIPTPESPCLEQFWLSQATQPRNFPLAVTLDASLPPEIEYAALEAVQLWNDAMGADVFEAPRSRYEQPSGDGTVWIHRGTVKGDRLAETHWSKRYASITIGDPKRLKDDRERLLVLMHELGHTLNLQDESDPHYVMSGRLGPKNTQEVSPNSRCLVMTALVVSGTVEESRMDEVRDPSITQL